MKIYVFLDKIERNHAHYPEYSLIMLDVVTQNVNEMEVSSSDFKKLQTCKKQMKSAQGSMIQG